MCKIIGICARKGAGRRTAAWLLAQTIEEQRKGTPYEKYKALFECWVKLVIIDPSEASSTDHVVLDSFGEHILDQLKQFCPTLVEYDLHDDNVLEMIYVNPYTFEVITEGMIRGMELDGSEVYTATAEEFAEYVELNRLVPQDQWLRLDQFIMYFARNVMKKWFGPNVWLNVAVATAGAMGSSDTRIYWDVKTQAELDYISKNKGIIIELRNADREKDANESYRDIKYLDPDVVLDTTLGLHTCAEKFWNITTQIRK